MRVIVTRPAAQALPFVERLRALGFDAVAQPLIGIEPPADPGAVRAAWLRLADAALAMFVSANAVAHFFEARPEHAGWPPATLAGSTGPGTSAALRAAGVPAGAIVEPAPEGPFDTEALWARLQHRDWSGQLALVIRGEGGRDWLAQRLQDAGARIEYVAAYRRVPPAIDAACVAAALARPQDHLWHFSSSEAIDHLLQGCPGADWSASAALATHPRIAERARRAGFAPVALVGVRADDVARWLQGRPPGPAPIESRPL